MTASGIDTWPSGWSCSAWTNCTTPFPSNNWFYSITQVSWSESLAKKSYEYNYKGADKTLAQPTSWCIFFDGKNISFDASLVIYTNNINIPPIVVINRIYEIQNVLSL